VGLAWVWFGLVWLLAPGVWFLLALVVLFAGASCELAFVSVY
jgi:hypothetical protein